MRERPRKSRVSIPKLHHAPAIGPEARRQDLPAVKSNTTTFISARRASGIRAISIVRISSALAGADIPSGWAFSRRLLAEGTLPNHRTQ